MKQLLLIGGKPWEANQDTNALAAAIRLYAKREFNVAFCNFARNHDDPHDKDKAMIDMFNRFAGDKKLSFKVMKSENFREVSQWADIIYMPGGDPALLKAELDKHKDLGKLWDDKIISGASAGADVMCTNYIYLQGKIIGEGLRWIKATCIPHWGNYEGYTEKDWETVREMALKSRPDLPVLCIPEGQIVEFAVQ